ncbi:hypothetical protein PIB30_031710 [Stylosanthes scabra]|uniref:Receptor-like serine/threonine-protein kinase n=1 Tax=Stylosanthes scabra TaxID=79078 RepID=A0ABU6SCF8_9FABA|nr:hypothetical protein [Stylosanthes scabra]
MTKTCTFSFSNSLLLPLLLLFIITPLSIITAIPDCNNPSNALSSLSTKSSSPWTSPSKDFAFGFQFVQFKDPRYVPLLSIYFTKTPNKTIVWYASPNREIPVGSSVNITNNSLVIYDPKGSEIWSRPETKDKTVTCASMQDNGNFVLKDKDGNIVWESFEDPSDTLLPGQNLSKSQPFRLHARQSETNFSTNNNFNLTWQGDGNLVLYYSQNHQQDEQAQNYPYWSTGTDGRGSFLFFDEFGSIYVVDDNNTKLVQVTAGIPGSTQYFYMARIESDGVFRLYSYQKTKTTVTNEDSCSSGWRELEQVPDDICVLNIGQNENFICGPNSYCVSVNGKPQCMCPDNYSYFVQPNDPNNLTSCRPNFPPPSCLTDGWETDPAQVDFQERWNLNWPFSDYEFMSGDFDKYTCRERCGSDCFCAAAVYFLDKDNVAHCWKKKYPLSNGRYSTKVENGTIVFLKFRKPGYGNKHRSYLTLVLSFLLGSSVFLNILLILGLVGVFMFLRKRKILGQQLNESLASETVRRYTYKELEKATRGFKQKLGQGAFGTVYKGVLGSDTKRFVAIKKLDKVVEEGEHRLLVYEYMSNGSLANFLFGISRPHWNQRVQIGLGIAKGLTYLHEECNTQFIHCDIKPQNILLDDLFAPRISDFGLAKLLLREQTRATRTHARGTVGYFAPEWFTKASVTSKVDVYSFGVVLLELICCKSSIVFSMSNEEEQALIDWAYDCYRHGKLGKFVENDEEAKNDIRRVEKHVMVAIWCVQDDPSLRPSMKKVTQMLEDVIAVPLPPRPSMFSSPSSASSSNDEMVKVKHVKNVHVESVDETPVSVTGDMNCRGAVKRMWEQWISSYRRMLMAN